MGALLVLVACARAPGDDSDGAPARAETLPATPLGLDALSVNGRVDVRGRPGVYWFELGETTAYGRSTAPAPLPARLGAHYLESWTEGPNGWQGGNSGTRLEHVASGGADGAGWVRYELPGELDAAHADGIGANGLAQYLYPGAWEGVPVVAALGGGAPDFRGARVSLDVRGEDFEQSTAEVVFWAQSTPNLAQSTDPVLGRWSNWAYTAQPYTEGLFSGDWERVEIRLLADSRAWTYAGHYVAADRATYVYVPIDQVLRDLNGDLFSMPVLFEYSLPPSGFLGFDEYRIDYAQRSVAAPGNGGVLRSAPAGTDPAALTDGWRHGPGHTWTSDPDPAGPLDVVVGLPERAAVHTVQVHQDPEWPSRGVTVEVSRDGDAWSPFAEGELPASHEAGPNFAYLRLHPDEPADARFVRVRVTSGWQDARWGLGEIEVFADDVPLATEDGWISVTADFTDLQPGTTWHYRVVVDDGETTVGQDRAFTVPSTAQPVVETLPVDRIAGGTARVQGRVDPLGVAVNYQFEFGPDLDYGGATMLRYGGLESTPRTVTDQLVELVPGTTYHVRLRAEGDAGTTWGEDVTFVAR